MNYADSERFAAIMEACKIQPTKNITSADVIIFNSCSVRQKAEDRILGLRKKIAVLKAKNPQLKIILTGCMARRKWQDQQENQNQKWQKSLLKRMDWVDYIIETKNFAQLPVLLGLQKEILAPITDYLSYPVKATHAFQAFIPISTGCNHFCTFCIVPFARGSEICRNYSDIYQEITAAITSGVKELTLLGQTVNRWINPQFSAEFPRTNSATFIPNLNKINLPNSNSIPKDFLQLLEKIDAIKGEWWFNFMSSHPNYLTKELIDFLSVAKHFRPYLHFALQSGSDRILKRMNRRHTIAEFKEKVLYIKKQIPNIAISTDIIVGFPGETEADFQETVKVMEELEFDLAYLAEYSARPGTASSILKDDVPHLEKERRKTFLNDEILAKTALKNNLKLLHQIVPVLMERTNKSGQLKGYTNNRKEITIKNCQDKFLIGTFQQAKVTKVTPWALEGDLE